MSVVVQTMASVATAPGPQRRPPLSPAISENDQLTELCSRISFPRRPLPAHPLIARSPSPISPVSPKQSAVRASFIASAHSNGLATVCADVKILPSLLRYLSWNDFHSLYGLSRSIRRVFLDATVKDTVLAHFIPGYRSALRMKDKRMWEDSIRMDYGDVRALVASLDTPLHRYPMHALSVVSSDLPTWEQMETTFENLACYPPFCKARYCLGAAVQVECQVDTTLSGDYGCTSASRRDDTPGSTIRSPR